jgi:class 3 adenylate cyclase/tetratricopeptide (TPR) repeat protein
MVTCPSCGRDNPEDARFCSACGTALAGADPPERESRKVVTVLFCDLVGSTSLGESTDPEALRARMRRYFEDLRAILERHGGSVEKFVGDAVMAVFGIPASHEDDALRAVRAAWEMREAVAAHGLEARIGVNSGEVVVGGQGETLVTGDAVNVAARLEQAAPPGEVLIGLETRQLIRDAVEVEPVEPLSLKGKSSPVEAFRVVELLAGAEAIERRLDRPIVGRERERDRLRRDYEDAVADRTCRLFTLLGPAGIGKSRLVADFLESVGDEADVLRGRCLHYGDGITYWPLVEMLSRIGVDADTVIGSSSVDTQLAFRRLLESRAKGKPQIVLLDDLHWAEPTFLELVEHVADLSRDVPIFLVCVGRMELLEMRPEWGGGKLNATSLLLQPLGEKACGDLIENLLADAELDEATRARIVTTSEGNPLFVEEMLAMVRERAADGEIVVPPTIHALLQARLDALDGDERVVMERGSVEGQVFHHGSVTELSPPPLRADVAAHLSGLVRKELIRPDSSIFAGDEAFRFRHLLIRDAAYESLPKTTRAELHEQFADWLAQHELIERDEILGYHLEQAHRYRAELDPADAALPGLARRGARHLAAGGRAAFDRGDVHGANALLERATAMLGGSEEGLALYPDLALAQWETGGDRFLETLADARAANDPLTRAHAAVVHAGVGYSGAAELTASEREGLREEARLAFEAADDQRGLAAYWWAVGEEETNRLHAGLAAEAAERALRCLASVGVFEGFLVQLARRRLRSAYTFSSIPVDLALERQRELAAEEQGLLGRSQGLATIGLLLCMKGEVDEARRLIRESQAIVADTRLRALAFALAFEGRMELRAGDLERAERVFCEGLEILAELGDTQYYPTLAAELANVLFERGRYDDVRTWHERARATTGADDLINFAFIGFVECAVHAHEGRLAEAEEIGRRTVELVDTTDYFWPRTASHAYLAEALALAGKHDEAAAHGTEALAIAEAKGDVLLAARFRERLAAAGVGGV